MKCKICGKDVKLFDGYCEECWYWDRIINNDNKRRIC